MVFRALTLGAGRHLLLDALQKRVVDAYGILFPFARKDVWVSLFWPDESLLLPVLLVLDLSIGLQRYISSRRRDLDVPN